MRTLGATVLAFALISSALSQTNQPANAGVKVPDAATAVRLAEKALAKVYGKKLIESERPFTATSSDGVWHVTGTLPCKDKKGHQMTGFVNPSVDHASLYQQRSGCARRIPHAWPSEKVCADRVQTLAEFAERKN